MRKYTPVTKHHSREFLRILREASPEKAIKLITHTSPLFVFWVSPNGDVIDAKNSHHDNPPNNDRSILSHKSHKGHLRGRAALIGGVVYIVIYGEGQIGINQKQLALLRRTYPLLLRTIKFKNKQVDQNTIDDAIFIDEVGNTLSI